MRKKLQQTGNSRALIINKEMLRHLGVAEVVEVRYIEGGILLTNPDSLRVCTRVLHQARTGDEASGRVAVEYLSVEEVVDIHAETLPVGTGFGRRPDH